MKSFKRAFRMIAGLSVLLLILGSAAAVFAAPTVTLTVLNVPNEFGDVVVVRGDSVEVELTVVDPLNESSSSDLIRLVRIADGAIANQQKRGKDLKGSRSLGTQKTSGSDVLGELRVQYISAATKMTLAVSDKNIFLVDNQAVVELTTRTSAVEEKADAAKARADAADAKATDAQSKADLLQAQADALRARADATDNELLAAKLERQAAKLERMANAAAAQEAKAEAAAAKTKADTADTKATAADIKAMDAKNRADAADAKAAAADARAAAADAKAAAADAKATAADTKATAADTKATAAEQQAASADSKADLALTETTNLQTQITQINTTIPAQSCPPGECVSGIDADGNFVCAPAAAAAAPALRLLAYYPLDGDVLDASGNAYDGTVGGTEAYAAGYAGQAFSFNRATYIATSLDIDVSVEPQLTMGAWVLPVGAFYGQVLTHDDQGFDRSLIYYNGDWRAYDGYGGGSVHTGFQPATGDWQFVAVVYDQDKQTVTMFVDGTAVTKAGQLLGPSVNMFRIANNESNGQEFFSGLIDEVFVVSGALSVTDLEQIRLSGVRSMFP